MIFLLLLLRLFDSINLKVGGNFCKYTLLIQLVVEFIFLDEDNHIIRGVHSARRDIFLWYQHALQKVFQALNYSPFFPFSFLPPPPKVFFSIFFHGGRIPNPFNLKLGQIMSYSHSVRIQNYGFYIAITCLSNFFRRNNY